MRPKPSLRSRLGAWTNKAGLSAAALQDNTPPAPEAAAAIVVDMCLLDVVSLSVISVAFALIHNSHNKHEVSEAHS